MLCMCLTRLSCCFLCGVRELLAKKDEKFKKHTSKYFIDFVLQCHFTDTSDFYSAFTSNAKTVFDV